MLGHVAQLAPKQEVLGGVQPFANVPCVLCLSHFVQELSTPEESEVVVLVAHEIHRLGHLLAQGKEHFLCKTEM